MSQNPAWDCLPALQSVGSCGSALQVACGGYHTLAVCEHDPMQQEAAERTRGYKQRIMQLFNSNKPAVEPSEASGGSSIAAGNAVNLGKVSGGAGGASHGSGNGEGSLPAQPLPVACPADLTGAHCEESSGSERAVKKFNTLIVGTGTAELLALA